MAVLRFITWLKIAASKFYDWRNRYGKVNEHNAWIPRDHWLEDWEKKAIIDFHHENPLEGYRRLTFMMLDRDVVAVSPSSVWRVLSQAGLLQRWNKQAFGKEEKGLIGGDREGSDSQILRDDQYRQFWPRCTIRSRR